ncbi:Chemotaxis protein CheX [Euzebya pacifica]|uniref:Chemotaxis protein CheX n=1 Tax=Euzebya pacifica TaxID=1608957 RepID=A0A346XT59_9ACTN|nr:chemotaxis protein CheX [Euzebya pacifica]AXV05406.1 Chemotaxis protein CheX [Euzebya pacifica]
MELSHHDIEALVAEIWHSVLGMDIGESSPRTDDAPSLSSLIHVHGAWEGTIVLHGPQALAASVAAAMFGMEADELSEDDIGDAFGEIANMLGGSVKALVDGPCSLSLPTVIGGTQYTLTVPGSTVLNESWFASAGHPLAVRVLQRASADVPAFA